MLVVDKVKNFLSVKDVPDLLGWVNKALNLKDRPFMNAELGKHKTLGLVFFNPSTRTRLSTQKAAYNLGMNVIVTNINQDGWQIETEDRVVMDGNTSEHIKEAARVMGQYCDIIGVRAFAGLQNQEEDYADVILNKFIQYAGVPVISLESCTRHPLQSFTDVITIEEYKHIHQPKVVLTWAPHPKCLPQAVPNSFVEWMKAMDYELVVTHPKGYELSDEFMKGVTVEYDQDKALEGTDFVYAKNWSSFTHYGKNISQDKSWMITMEKMALTNHAKFMHCLPVRRNVVVEDAVLDSDYSVATQQAGNRVVAAQVVLQEILKDLNK